MLLRIAALAAFAAMSCLPATAWSQQPPRGQLTLDDAFTRVASAHPDLRLFGARTDALLAERDQASLKPALRVGLEVENALGSGPMRGFDAAGITLGLAGVLERGGQLDARQALAQARIDALAVQRQAQRLDLLAETARRYLAVAAAQSRADIDRQDIEQRRRTVAAARHRLQAGASPESVLLAAEAGLANAGLALERSLYQEQSALRHLAALWGQRDPDFILVATDPLRLPAIASLAQLTAHLQDTPELVRFVDEQRIGEARLQLARSAARADLDWQFGVRRLQDGGDTALVAGVSLPLGGTRRAQPEIDAARTALEMLGIERESLDLALYSTLVDAHGRFGLAQLEVRHLADEVLPRLARAERAAERAYRAGATSYLEWAQLQSERTDMQRTQLESALQAHLAFIEIQRLTGQPFLAHDQANARGTPP